MTDPASLLRHVAATVHGRTLVRPPATASPHRWFVGFHGYGQSAEMFMESLAAVPGSTDWLTASVQALHPFYARGETVVANWMTRQDRELAIADNIAYADAVLDALAGEFGAPRKLVIAGFSQGVAMAYRAGVAGRRGCDAILAVAGDLPPELKTGPARGWPKVRIVVGDRETFYTSDRVVRDAAFLRENGVDVRASTFAGGHEWSSAVLEAAAVLLAEVG